MNRSAYVPKHTSLPLRLLGVILSLCSACADEPPSVAIRLITSLVPRQEFQRVETTVLVGGARDDAARWIANADSDAVAATDYSRGVDVGVFALSEGEYRIRVRLLRSNGSTLVERTLVATVSGDAVIPVHITRDCVGVVCPNATGSAERSTCLAGQCVDPRCSPSAREFCPDLMFCNDASQCGATSECAEPVCVESLCVQRPIRSACTSTEWCNPDVNHGCEPVTTEEPPPFPCDTICFDALTPCLFGYWRCGPSSEPVCETLAMRPSGYVCAPEMSCNLVGDCVPNDITLGGVTIAPSAGIETSETGTSAILSVHLDTAPTANVTVTFDSNAPGEATVSPTSLVFTPTDWSTTQTIAIVGINDDIEDGDQPFEIAVATASSADPAYLSLSLPALVGVNHDDDAANIVVSPTSGLTTTESGAEATFTLVLTTEPTDDVSVALASDDSTEGSVLPSTVLFNAANWNVPQVVTVLGVDDTNLDGPVSFQVVTSPAASTDANYAGLDPADVVVTNLDDVSQQHFVKASNPDMIDGFGMGVALSGDGNTMAISSLNEASVATGINGDQSDNSALSSGAVYLFVRSGTSWVQQAYIKASNTDGNDHFGIRLALSRDGDTLVAVADWEDSSATGIGGSEADNSSSNTGAAYVFSRTGSTWTQQAYIKASNAQASDVFGSDVALSADGNTMAISAAAEASNATGVDGLESDNSANRAGAVYLFQRSAGVWTQSHYVKASNTAAGDGFSGLALSADGSTLAVSAGGEASSARGINGDQSDNSAVYAGAVYIFVRSGMSWAQQAYIKASNADANDMFGSGLSLSGDGSTLAVGATGEDSSSPRAGGVESDNSVSGAGAVYLFARSGSTWTQSAFLKAATADASDAFGQALRLSRDGSVLLVGAAYEDSNARSVGGDDTNNTASGAGAAYLLAHVGADWLQVAYIKSANADAGDNFGTALGLSDDGRTIAISALGESSNAIGVDGDGSNNLVVASGAVYLFATD